MSRTEDALLMAVVKKTYSARLLRPLQAVHLATGGRPAWEIAAVVGTTLVANR